MPFWSSISHADPLAVGLNCATGPEFMTDHIRTLHELAWTNLSCYPNAGLPDERRHLSGNASLHLAAQLERFVKQRMAEHCRRLLRHYAGPHQGNLQNWFQAGRRPRAVPSHRQHRSFYSGIDLVEAEDSTRPLIVGERTNVIGSRLFRELIAEEKWDEATEIGRRQVRAGAHIVDVCLQSSERDELPRHTALSTIASYSKIKAPIMIDTTDPEAVELALSYCQGKSIINSVNLEDGEEKFKRVCPICQGSYGAALIAGCIDEDPSQAQAFTRERKLSVAERSYGLLTGKYGIPPGRYYHRSSGISLRHRR